MGIAGRDRRPPPAQGLPGEATHRTLLGVLLAGGEGRRFGGGKPLAPVAGRPMAAWGLDALRPHVARLVVVAGDPEVGQGLGVPSRPDRISGAGPLGGLCTGLEWAVEEGLPGVFLLACDLPLVGEGLVETILTLWPPAAPAVVPSSPGPRGFEPLCAGYRVECLPRALELLREGRRAMAELVESVGAARLPLEFLGAPGALRRAFTNVNTREDAERVGRLLQEATS